MNASQRIRIKEMTLQGFALVGESGGSVRVAKGADHRVIQADGTVKRGQPGGHGGRRG